MDVTGMRESYPASGQNYAGGADPDITPAAVADGWVPLFETWLAEAVAAGAPEPNAMVLGTVAADGQLSTRTVLCKGYDDAGVVFYTNYGSAKARDIAANPVAAVTFPWLTGHRQVHLRGAVEKVTEAETLAYWAARPRGSQLGAWASDQSATINSRVEIADKFAQVQERFDGSPVPLPEFWGGFRVRANRVEFWQGRENRVHNRVRLTRQSDGWSAALLQP